MTPAGQNVSVIVLFYTHVTPPEPGLCWSGVRFMTPAGPNVSVIVLFYTHVTSPESEPWSGLRFMTPAGSYVYSEDGIKIISDPGGVACLRE